MELQKHIEILLLSNDCVIVPGLGGFTTSHIAAKYDERDNMFLPPIRTLGFNSRLDSNDFLLAQSYAEAYDISYPEALTRIQDEINELRRHLEEDGSFELYGIGILRLNNNCNIEFTPSEAGILTPKLYGLSSFEMSPIKPIQVSQKVSKKETIPTISFATMPLSGDSSKVDDNFPSNKEKVTDNSSERVIMIKYSVLRNACIGVVSAILLLALFIPIKNSESLNKSNIDGGIFHNLINNGVEKVKSSKDLILNSNNTKAPTPKEETKVKKEILKDYYCLVLASKIPQENAEAFVKELSVNGLSKAHVLNENNSFKVVYGQYLTQEEAYNNLKSLRGNNYFSQAWVYQVRN